MTSNLTVTALYEVDNRPVLSVGSITAKAGDEIEIPVYITDNPGLLGMTFLLEYDDSVILIDWVDHGSDKVFNGLSLQEPPRYKSGCRVIWYGSKLRKVKDGECMLITATIADDAPAGTYTFRIYDEEIIDQDGNNVAVKYITGTITITD